MIFCHMALSNREFCFGIETVDAGKYNFWRETLIKIGSNERRKPTPERSDFVHMLAPSTGKIMKNAMERR